MDAARISIPVQFLLPLPGLWSIKYFSSRPKDYSEDSLWLCTVRKHVYSVETQSHSVETQSHSVETQSHSVETQSHNVETQSHSVEAQLHSVET